MLSKVVAIEQIWLVNVNTAEQQLVVSAHETIVDVVFSESGSQAVYLCAGLYSGFDLYILDSDLL